MRGNVRFKAHVPMKDFVNEFAAALRRVRALSVDSTGFIERWQYTFPQAEYETIERKAVKKFGYKPKRRQEIADT